MTAGDAVAAPLPMFPLGSVLVPGALLPLHVFEPRYRALVRHCLRHGNEFGVVLIERGPEVGGGDVRLRTGTVARILEAVELPDGRWALLAVGERRIRVCTWLPDDPYPIALVDGVETRPLADTDDERTTLRRAEQAVRRGLAHATELGDVVAPATLALADEPDRAAWQLVAAAPLGPADRQALLEVDDPHQRVQLLTELAAEAADVLAYRLAGG